MTSHQDPAGTAAPAAGEGPAEEAGGSVPPGAASPVSSGSAGAAAQAESVVPDPPHLATLELAYVPQEQYEDYSRAVARGFQAEMPDEIIAVERGLHEPDRFFGYRAGQRWVATFGAYSRQLTVPGGARVPVAAITAVTVQPPYRRRGLLGRMMLHQLQDSERRGEAIAVLWASEAPIYGRFGFGQAVPRLRLSGQTRSTTFRRGVDLGAGSVDEVSREQYLALAPAVHDAVAAGRPGGLDRPAKWWPQTVNDPAAWRGKATPWRFVVCYDAAGAVGGHATYRFTDDYDHHGPKGHVTIGEVEATSPVSYARLWRYLLDLDLVRSFRKQNAALDDPLRHLVADSRSVYAEGADGLYLRVVDVREALLARRYSTEVDVAIEVIDPLLDHNTATYTLINGPDGARVRRSRRRPDLSLDIRELGAVYLGGPTLLELQAAGLVAEHVSGSVAAASAAFRGERAPFCTDLF